MTTQNAALGLEIAGQARNDDIELCGAYLKPLPDTPENQRMPTTRVALGNAAEQLALDYLLQQGLHLVQRNFRCRNGELDLIMRDADTLVFVEVRSRRSAQYGDPAASVTPAKQRKLLCAATCYLQREALELPPCRLDVVAILGHGAQKRIEWIKDAFRPE